MKENILVSTTLQSILKKTNPKVQNFILALQKKNAKLEKEVANLEVENMSLNNRIKSLPDEMKNFLEFKKGIGDIPKDKLRQLSQKLKDESEIDLNRFSPEDIKTITGIIVKYNK